jgi:hypothetical protein
MVSVYGARAFVGRGVFKEDGVGSREGHCGTSNVWGGFSNLPAAWGHARRMIPTLMLS